MNRFSLPSLALPAVLAVAGSLLTACGKPSAQQSGQMPPPEVNVVVVQARDLPATFEQVGQISGVRQVEVRPRVTGILQHWNYREGTAVAARASLFTIDPAPFRAAVARVEAELASAEARQAQAQRTAARLARGWGMVSRKAFDDALSAKEVAAAGVKSAEAALRQGSWISRIPESRHRSVVDESRTETEQLVEAADALTPSFPVDPIHVISASGIRESQAPEGIRRRAIAVAGRALHRHSETVRRNDVRAARPVDFSDVRINPRPAPAKRAVLPNLIRV